ncbi:MAG: SDR family oxidoreductase [Chloroflexi bacterium AL-W]|nr:SDR family oxidoreductase [Chloroflexi bacterium AL-N1]NOK69216.1 SDR family oxidoreductase [Chloroflexi bacterium AL-N10]NOK77199.1 SDR family oxidoreductase [Chloroflexi bacterium AL-N5]NOK83844.1 SDR family oxidoreductase [Chloroflexi bacterium AL-W]NOK91054.1 SDR family oxidoreductase [Chloroflexi bacterium AL-N15]
MKLQGRVAIVTGASSGVGYETARLLAREGASVAAAARRPDKLEELVSEIAHSGGHALALPTDVTDPVQVERLVESVQNLLGRIDILVNSVGVMLKVAPLEQFSDTEFHTVIDTNLSGCFYMTRAVIPYMKQQRSGTIINISSRVGKEGVANIAPFCAAKFALDGLSQSLSLELRPYNIYVTTVFPGLINTDIYPLNPSDEIRRQLMSAQDVAETVLWTCTLPSSVRIDNLSIMPRQLDM